MHVNAMPAAKMFTSVNIGLKTTSESLTHASIQFAACGNAMPVLRMAPKFSDYADQYLVFYKAAKDAKRSSTIETGGYLSNTVVTVTAISDSGWVLLGWKQDASGTNPTVNNPITRKRGVPTVFGTSIATSAAGHGPIETITDWRDL